MKFRFLPEDINTRALGGVLVHKGLPYLVENWNQEEGYFLRNLHDARRSFSSKEVFMDEVKLGNVQLGKSFGYVARVPFRRFKQTITTENCRRLRMPFECRNLQAPVDLYQVDYPRIDVALRNVVEKKLVACCFHKEFGWFRRDGGVFLAYRDQEVGQVKDNTLHLYEKKFYLKELIQELFKAA